MQYRFLRRTSLALAFLPIALTGAAQPASDRARPPFVSGYAALASRTVAAPVILTGKVDAVDRIDPKAAPGLAPGYSRYLLRLAVSSAVRAPGPVPAKIRFLWDAPGPKRADVTQAEVIAFLEPQTVSDYRLTRPDGLIAASDVTAATIRAIVAEARNPDVARAQVTGVQSASYTPGTIPGEAESQFFLKTSGGGPVSLVVVSQPGEAKRLSAAFGDVIDEAAKKVTPNTLPWFYLACGLPPVLPISATEGLDPIALAGVRTDYAFVLESLGSCDETP